MATDPRVDACLAARPPAQAAVLGHLRDVVRRLVPDAVETISYGMPSFKLGRHFLLSYAGWTGHCSIYPLTGAFRAAHAAELAGFGGTKGSIHFTPEYPLPDELLASLVLARAAELEADRRP